MFLFLDFILDSHIFIAPSLYRPADTQTVFVCRRGTLIPISKDAELIYAANSHSVEQYTKQQLLPNVQASQTSGKLKLK